MAWTPTARWILFVTLFAASLLAPPPRSSPHAAPRSDAGFSIPLLPPDQPLRLAIGLASRDPWGLQRALTALYDPRSPRYHHYLTPAQYEARFGPDPAAVRALSGWLRAQGLWVGPWSGGQVLDVHGSADAVGAVFHLRFAHAGPLYAVDSRPTLPAPLAHAILGIGGLDNLARPTAHARQWRAASMRVDSRTAFAPSGAMDPAQVQTAYDYLPLYAQGLHGEGTAVDLVELAPYSRADIDAYAAYYGVHPTITDTAVEGGAADQPPSIEPALDIEELATSAPAAAIHVYSAPDDTTTGILHALAAVAQARDAAVVEIGWTICEPFARSLYGFVETMHAALKQMALEGMTVVAPSGDSGAYGCGASPVASEQGIPAVSLPASDPYVTSVGGTVLTLDAGNGIAAETAWSCPHVRGGCGGGAGPLGYGSGGGLSNLFFTGDPFGDSLGWQRGPGVRNSASNGHRQVPDVALSGTQTSGIDRAYAVYYQGVWTDGGGTSAAAPMWAALFLLADQYAQRQGRPPLGWVNPALYQLGADGAPYPPYHDVTSGDNLLYPATPGWDYATGWGSVDAWNLVRDLAQQAAPFLPTPVTPPTATAAPVLTPTATAPIIFTPPPSATPTPIRPRPTATRTVTATPRPPNPTATRPRPAPAPPAYRCPAIGLGNGSFEAGNLACWQTGGTLPPRLVPLQRYRGHEAVRLGAARPPSYPGASILSQRFTLPTRQARTLRLVYWRSDTVPDCYGAASCPRLLPPTVQISGADGRVLAHAVLPARPASRWTALTLPFHPRGGPVTLRIAVPAEPPFTTVLLYLDDIRVE